jgi:protein-L-isoaspartate(D-aspartate) O-methyltransferase
MANSSDKTDRGEKVGTAPSLRRQPVLGRCLCLAAAVACGAGLTCWLVWSLNRRDQIAPPSDARSRQPGRTSPTPAGGKSTEDRADERRRMVDEQFRARGVASSDVLEAFERVQRHLFVPPEFADLAYADQPLPIGRGQTISQPYVVALMTELARPNRTSRALDVGTGSGYQAAVLAELCHEVYSVEIVRPLAEAASRRLTELGYNIEVRCGDGYRGWPEHAPFDVIIVAAAPDHVPQPLVDQLAPGGRLVLPVGRGWQEITVVEKLPDGITRQWTEEAVMFVPMTGEAQR